MINDPKNLRHLPNISLINNIFQEFVSFANFSLSLGEISLIIQNDGQTGKRMKSLMKSSKNIKVSLGLKNT